MDPDQALFDAGLRRIARATLALSAAACSVLLVWKGWRWSLGFALGAAASYFNFRWLKRVVDALGSDSPKRPSRKFAILMGLRYLLLGAGAYAILRFTTLSLPAALTGLFVPAGAVVLEIVYELIYA